MGRKEEETVARDGGMREGRVGMRYSESGGREKGTEVRMGLEKGRKERRESQ